MSITTGELYSLIAENNKKYGTDFQIRQAYGYYELWSGNNRIDAGTRNDVYRAFIKYRFNERFRKPTRRRI
jgi:hypothetical protein